jgi:hypothetical protein
MVVVIVMGMAMGMGVRGWVMDLDLEVIGVDLEAGGWLRC